MQKDGYCQVLRYSSWPTTILYTDTVTCTTREDHHIAENMYLTQSIFCELSELCKKTATVKYSGTHPDQPRYSILTQSPAQHAKITILQKICTSHNPYSVNLASCAKWRLLSRIRVLSMANHETIYRCHDLHNTRRSPFFPDTLIDNWAQIIYDIISYVSFKFIKPDPHTGLI